MRVFWAWVEGATGNIALALESVVEQVWLWVSGVGLKGLGLPSSMDTLNTLLVGWMLFVTLILILGSFFYFKFIHQLDNESESMSEDTGPKREPRDEEKSQTGGGSSTRGGKAGKSRQPPAEPARTPTIVPHQPPLAVSPPVATGADPDAVAWTTNVFTWLYNSPEGGKVIKKIWLDTVNENTVKTAIDTGILVEVVELLPASPAPKLSNMVVDCSPSDNVTITCDCDATMYLRLVTTRTQGENTTESEYACAVQPLRGRLNIATLTADLMCVVKFDGWPEVLLRLEGIRNNATGLDEQTMQDVIMEVLSSALRNSVLDLNFKPVPTFPRFRRARQQPEPIIPVGYDSMVREMQTHPPSAKASPRPAPTCAPGPAPAPASAYAPAPSVEEVLEVAGESFTALSFAASPGLNSGLTMSEEQLIARNLYKYPSLENTDLEPEEIADLCKTWQKNYVPTAEVPTPTATEEEIIPRSDSYQEQKDEAPGQNFVLVASNRSKMIDEPRSVVSVEDTQAMEDELEEEPELVLLTTQKPHDEPCIRRQSGSPLLLSAPRVSNDTTVVVNKEESPQDGPMTLDLIAKSLGVVDGSPGLGSQQNEFPVSDAWCAGVAARTPQLDPRAVGGVACDLECTQEDLPTSPTFPPVHPKRKPPSPSPDPPLSPSLLDSSACGLPVENIDEQSNQSSSYMGDEGKDLGSSDSAMQTRSSTSDQGQSELECRDWEELDCTVEGKTKNTQYSQVVNEAEFSSDQTVRGFKISELEETGVDQSEGSHRILLSSLQCSDAKDAARELTFHPDHFTATSDREDYENETVRKFEVSVKREFDSREEYEAQLGCNIEAQAKDDVQGRSEACEFYHLGSHEDESLAKCEYGVQEEDESLSETKFKTCKDGSSSSDCENNLEFRDENGSNKDDSSISHKSDDLRLRKHCLNEFTESLFSRIELEDSEISLPEEFTEEAAWEVTEVYEMEEDRRRGLDVSRPNAYEQSDDETRISDSILGKPEDDSLISVSSSDKPDTTSSGSQFTSSLAEDQSSDSKELCPETGICESLIILETPNSEQSKKICNYSGQLEVNRHKEMRESEYCSSKQNYNEKRVDLESFSQEVLASLQAKHPELIPNKLKENGFKSKISNFEKQVETPYTEANPASMNDPFSPEEEDFGCHDDEDGNHNDHIDSEASDSLTNSEVEEITGKDEEGHGHQPHSRSHTKREWRKSDIIQIAEAELIDPAPQDSITTTRQQDKMSSQDSGTSSSQMDEQLFPHIINESSLIDMQFTTEYSVTIPSQMSISPQDNVAESSQMDTYTNLDYESLGKRQTDPHDQTSNPDSKDLHSPGLNNRNVIGSDLVSTEGLPHLTQKHNSCVATLAQIDAPDTLTHPHGTAQTQKPQLPMATKKNVAINTKEDANHHYHHPPTTTTGCPQWTRPLASYPVYGTYYVTSSLPTITTTTNQPMGIPALNGKRLLVKIVKATGVGCDKSVSDAYAVVEMDEPPQKFTTSVAKDTNSPFWDEQFLFDLSGGTLELLFELYDRRNGNFLGLGIVGIEELVATPSQRQIIPLQSRPYENDHVSGSLTVEFLFLDRAEVPEHTVRTSATSQSLGPRGALVTTTTTTYVKAPEGVDCGGEETTNQASSPEEPFVNPDIIVNGGEGVAAAALRDIEEKKAIVANNASKSTMIIHASRKAEEEALSAVTALIATASPTTTTTQTSPQHSTMGTTTTIASTENADTTEANGTEDRGRSRGVRRKRDSFFGTLKKRFSRSKIRSKSMEPGRDPSDDLDQSVGRSISMERSTNVSRASGLLSVPPDVGGRGGDGGSTRSSLSDASAISGSSTRTYINEASTLIVETTENGVFKHYLIPLPLQQKSKWRKKGTKLHIYGEHTFVAKHMSSSTQCEVCGKNMGRRLGKQGYACRDCGYRCHKPCHVKTDTTCPSSTVNTMDLEYVKDVREERRAWLKKNKTT